MTRQQSDRLSLYALLGSLAGGYIGFRFWFAPGWANGWPGLPRRLLWSVGLTVVAFLTGVAVVVGSGAAACTRLGIGDRVPSRTVYLGSITAVGHRLPEG